MDSILDILWLRVPPIRYISPPACPIEFSGSGSSGPIIVVEHPPRFKVTGLRVENCTLFWDALPGACVGSCAPALCYNIYRSATATGAYEVVAECVNDTQFSVEGQTAYYRVSALTTEGESDLSDIVFVECGSGPPPPPEEPVSELGLSTDGITFNFITLPPPLATSDNPLLTLKTNSIRQGINLNWDTVNNNTFVQGADLHPMWCFKVRGIEPTVGNYSNEVCAVFDMFFLGTGAVSYPTWELAFGDFGSDDITLVTDLDLSGLKAVLDGGNLFLDASFILNSLNLDSLQIVEASFHLSLTTITTLNLPELTTIGGNFFCDNTSLVDVSIPNLVLLNGKTYAFDSSALNAASVEGILARGIASGVTSATIFLDGGTNAGLASLSAQGQADYAALVLAGNTVSINA